MPSDHCKSAELASFDKISVSVALNLIPRNYPEYSQICCYSSASLNDPRKVAKLTDYFDVFRREEHGENFGFSFYAVNGVEDSIYVSSYKFKQMSSPYFPIFFFEKNSQKSLENWFHLGYMLFFQESNMIRIILFICRLNKIGKITSGPWLRNASQATMDLSLHSGTITYYLPP